MSQTFSLGCEGSSYGFSRAFGTGADPRFYLRGASKREIEREIKDASLLLFVST